MELHGYQLAAINFALKKKSTYMMIDRGLGKTAIALKAIESSGYPAFVFAPMRVCYNTWPEEIKLWTPRLSYTILHGKLKENNLKLNRRVYLLNYDGIKWFYNAVCAGKFKLRKFFIVFDESSMLKNPSTMRLKKLKKMMSMFSQYRMNLSATPAPNSRHELWPQYYMLDKGKRLGRYFGEFANYYFIYSGPPQYKYWIKKGGDKAMDHKIEDITFRLRGEDYLNLPPITYNAIKLSFTPALQKQYDKIEKQYLLEMDGQVIPLDSDASAQAKAHQFVQGAIYTDVAKVKYRVMHDLKIKALKEVIDTSGGQPIMCAIWYKFEYEMICEALGYRIPVIAGRTTAAESNEYIRKWNKGRIPLLLVQPKSVQFGLNLQAGGNILLWYSLTWSLESYIQLVGRLARQGQKKAVIVHHLAIQNTIDDVFIRTLSRKDATQNDMLEAMRNYMRGKYR